MAKPKLAFYWASACGGCDVAVLDVNERVLTVADLADIVFWPIALDVKYSDLEKLRDGEIDFCLFNGAIRNSENRHLARLLRKKSRILIAVGACAQLGGIPGLANLSTRDELLAHVYEKTRSTVNPEGVLPSTEGGDSRPLQLPEFFDRVEPLASVVPVDYSIPGCPPEAEQIWKAIEMITSETLPAPGSVIGAGQVALCEECPRTKSEKHIKEFRSVSTFAPDPEICLLEQGVICCGPATRAGCGARCVRANMPCRGCYGPLDGVEDQGSKLLSAIASVIDGDDPEEVERIVDEIQDPAGTFYRFSLPSAFIPAASRRAAGLPAVGGPDAHRPAVTRPAAHRPAARQKEIA